MFAAIPTLFPVTSVQATGRPVEVAAAQHSASGHGLPASTDSVEVVRGIAPEWPFQGFFAPALGRFWDTGRGRVHDVGNGIDFGACYESYVEVDAGSVRMGYWTYFDRKPKHYVISWGGIAYPVINRYVGSQRSSDATGTTQEAQDENFRLTSERISFTPEIVSEYSEETENTYHQIVAFWAHNSVDRKLYLPVALERRRFAVAGFVEIEPEDMPVGDLWDMRDVAPEFGGLGAIQFLPLLGSDGRFYGYSLYRQAHPMCSDEALSFVVDGITGQVVACYDYTMEAQTPLVFVANEDSFVSGDFALPNAMWPVDADACGVRLDGDRPEDFFRLMTGAGWPGSDDLDGAGT